MNGISKAGFLYVFVPGVLSNFYARRLVHLYVAGNRIGVSLGTAKCLRAWARCAVEYRVQRSAVQ